MDYKFQLFIFLDILIATALAGFIGYERERMHKPAGIRTNMIVAGFACLVVSLARPLVDYVENYNLTEIIRTDPIRILEAIIVGVSFIGAGTILKQTGQNKVHGLTTAATLLFSSGLGVCIALKQYLLGILTTVLIITINFLVSYLTRRFTSLKDDENLKH